MESRMNSKEASNIVGKLSRTSKMPCHSYNLPATRCITGSKMVKIKGLLAIIVMRLKECIDLIVLKMLWKEDIKQLAILSGCLLCQY